jgi:signal transduction histidine kinase
MAIGALEVLHMRGVRVPEDVALVGFDDMLEASLLPVPLTTVRQSYVRSAQIMMDVLLRRIDGERFPAEITFPTELVIRQSCGCLSRSAEAEIAKALLHSSEPKASGGCDGGQVSLAPAAGVPTPLLMALLADAQAESNLTNAGFLAACEAALREMRTEREYALWRRDVLGVLSDHSSQHLGNPQHKVRAMLLLDQAQQLVNQAQQRTAAHEQVQRQQKMTSLQYFNRDIVAVLALEELGPVVKEHFPVLDISRGYISLYEGDALPLRARLILAYKDGEVEQSGKWPSFPLHHLAPAEVLPREQGYTMIATPFLLRDQQLGFGLFEMELDAQVGEIYDRLSEQFSGALFRALLLQQLEAANQAMRQNLAELEASNAELDAFAHTVAHDLKNPIGALIGFSSMLEACWLNMSTGKIVSTLQRVTAAGYKLARIVDEILLLASVRKMEQVPTSVLDMPAILAETRERLADMIAASQVEIIAPETWPEAVGYAPWIEEIWANYIGNALKYGGTPPRVELGYSLPKAERSLLESSNQPPATRIRFWVQDNGAGLTPAVQARLFTEFTRLEQMRAEGHGLGLSIVQRIVAKLGGEVGVESEVGRGSRFWFTLPVAAQLPSVQPGKSRPPQSLHRPECHEQEEA